MAASITITYDEARGPVKRVKLDWTSHTDGTVSGIATKALNGQLQRVVFVSDSGGTQPTDLYDVTLLDEDGADVLGGVGANVDRTAVKNFAPICETGTNGEVLAPLICGTLTLTIANAGDSKGGEVILYLR